LRKIPTSLLGRGSKLLGVASKIALQELGSRVRLFEDEKNRLLSRIELAQDVVKTLSELKGASMKVGQLLTLDLGDYLPPEVLSVLEKLHHQSTFLPYQEIEKIILSELNFRFHDLKNISETPIAAASIGQVHKARIAEQDVVIKIQYPGVSESIPADLRMLEILLGKLLLLQRKNHIDLSALLEEVKQVMLKETDYDYERKMHLLYYERFSESAYYIPKIYPDYCTKKILTQEYVPGLTFGQWLTTAPSFLNRKNIADLMLKLYLEELFVAGLVQTDPNPGNFIITPTNQIALLDFGATKVYSQEFVSAYKQVIIHSYHQNQEKMLEEAIKLKLIDPRETDETKHLFVEMMDFLVTPFRQQAPFDFSDKVFFERSRNMALQLAQKSQYTSPPKELVFLHRKLGGIFSFLKKLDVKIKLNEYWHRVDPGF
jgi:aarF domain-containing kinase